jgi:hypothetical protein
LKISMTKLESVENIKTCSKLPLDYQKLIMLYNRLDSTQRVEFRNELESLIKQPILPQRIEEYLFSLSQEHYERMFAYTQLLLFSC